MPDDAIAHYQPLRPARSTFVNIRRLRYHVHQWGDATLATPKRPPLVLMHGWMDVGASYQFLVDALTQAEGFERWVLAPDWRGFGLTLTPDADTYWFPDYLADLEALLDTIVPAATFGAIDLLGHSMGGNVVMSYAGVRQERIRRLVNLEGFGMPRTQPEQAPQRLAQWLDELKAQQPLRSYASTLEVAARLRSNNPLLSADKAAWLAPHWASKKTGAADDGRWHVNGHPAHKHVNPVLYQVDEVLATWKQIQAPLLWVDGDRTDVSKWWGSRYSRGEFDSRLNVVRDARRVTLAASGHMLHHDQPQALAAHLAAFLGRGADSCTQAQ